MIPLRNQKTNRKGVWGACAAVVAALIAAAVMGLNSQRDNDTPPNGESLSPETTTIVVDMQGVQLELTPNWMPAGRELTGQPYTSMIDSLTCADISHTDCARLTVIDLNTYEQQQGRPYGPGEGEECFQYNPALEGTWYGGEERVEETTIAGLSAVHFTYAACEVDGLTMSTSLPDSPDPSTVMDLWLIDGRYAVSEFNLDPEFVETVLESAQVTE